MTNTTKKWRDIRKKRSPEREAAIKANVDAQIAALSLNRLREARDLTQTNLAKTLNVPQGSISKMERRSDMYISTLRSYIEAMGGELKLTAVFDTGTVEISQFCEAKRETTREAGQSRKRA